MVRVEDVLYKIPVPGSSNGNISDEIAWNGGKKSLPAAVLYSIRYAYAGQQCLPAPGVSGGLIAIAGVACLAGNLG